MHCDVCVMKRRCEISSKSSPKRSPFIPWHVNTSVFKYTNTLLKWIRRKQASCSCYKENSICKTLELKCKNVKCKNKVNRYEYSNMYESAMRL